MARAARILWGGVAAVAVLDLLCFFLVYRPGDLASLGFSLSAVSSMFVRSAPFWLGVLMTAGFGAAFFAMRGRSGASKIARFGERGYSPLAVPDPESVVQVRARLKALDEAVRPLTSRMEPDAVGFLNEILENAVQVGASDIHIHPLEEGTRVQFRVHGLMEELGTYPPALHPRLVTRLKVLSDLVTYHSDRPQDGHFTVDTSQGVADIRISVLPTMHGEKVVLRLLRGGVELPDLRQLGFPDTLAGTTEQLLARPQGMVFLTGPTGSGKTTTIYAALGHIKKARGDTAQIATIEDPVEYDVPFLTQTAVNATAGLDFAAGLRSILRQDPDVMMVGEIRDSETAQIAVQAGLTGHLILTTVHANSASGVFNRLIEMGIEPFLLASASLACISQRLVRGLCPYCRTDKPASPEEVAWLKSKNAPLGETFYVGQGCTRCGETGYLGRIAIFELLRVSEKIQAQIQERVATPEIESTAREEGMIPIVEAAIRRAAEGATTLREVMRVTG